MCLATIADGKTAASDNCKTTLRRREEQLKKLKLSPLLDANWVGPWAVVEYPYPENKVNVPKSCTQTHSP